jgi:hypothetical protein
MVLTFGSLRRRRKVGVRDDCIFFFRFLFDFWGLNTCLVELKDERIKFDFQKVQNKQTTRIF